jgi:DNA-binding GntR family transcriptional regulator
MSVTSDGQPPIIVRGSSLRTQVKQAIEDLIVYGTLEPGEHLVEGALAERLGVSRQPVREALQSLASVGFIELHSGRGAFVHRPTPREVYDTFHVRAVLEADAAAQAASVIDDDTLAELSRIVDQGLALANGGDPRTLLDLNATFHDLITGASGNRVSRQFLDDLKRRIAWFLATIISNRAPSSWEEHALILEALRRRDPVAVSDLVRQHVERSLELVEFAV